MLVEPVFFSIVSANYMAYAITLMESVRTHHPDAPRFVFLADEPRPGLEVDPSLFTLVPVQEIGLPHPEHFAFRYSILEFNTALKPYAFRWLAIQYPDRSAVYLDPDILVLNPLEAVQQALSAGKLAVLTPHLTAPLDDDKHPNELSIMRAGAYNLGFVALGPHPRRSELVDWWAGKLEFDARIDFEAGLFTDQKWVDLFPGLFPDVHILRAPGYNLAYWNLLHRHVTNKLGEYEANGEPLVFVHFSGVDVHHPEQFSKYQNRFDSDSIGELRPLYMQYLELLKRNGHEEFSKIEYAWARLRDGTPISNDMRSEFRRKHDVGRQRQSSDPFGLTGPSVTVKGSPLGRLSRVALRLYPRIRSNRVFRVATSWVSPESRWAIRQFLVRRSLGRAEPQLSQEPAPERPRLNRSQGAGPAAALGVNLIGYLKGEFGVAEAGRSLARSAKAGGADVTLMNVSAGDAARENDLRFAAEIESVPRHAINILCVNADQTPASIALLGPGVFEGRYTVGVWFWELAHFPQAWRPALDAVDEIWVASSFVQASVAEATSKPVRIVPMAVEAQPSRPYTRGDFGLPGDSFVFLFSFDFASFVARKNPHGVISAFRSAFPAGTERVRLLLKTTNGHRMPAELSRVREAIGDDKRIQLSDGFISRDEMFGLESVADSYVSLHRSEGFGLGLAESMSLGKPVIGTAYSGNVDFMGPNDSCMVGFEFVPVKRGEYPFSEGQVWADPDLDQAAYFMRRVANDAAFARRVGLRARQRIEAGLSTASVGRKVRLELERIASGSLR